MTGGDPSNELARAMRLDEIRYSQVWEDHRVLEEALAISPEDDILSIGSAGCNVLALLLQQPRSIVAIDMSPAQMALMELKLAGIRHLEHGEFVRLLGVREADDRLQTYRSLRSELPETVRTYWDGHETQISEGIIHCGRLDTYFRVFHERFLPSHWPPDLIVRLLNAQTTEEAARTYAEAATPAFADRVRWYFSREMVDRYGRDPAQARYVTEADTGSYLLQRLRHVCTAIPVKGNFYLEYFLTGRYSDLEQGPPFLRPANFERLKGLIDRVQCRTVELESFLHTVPAGSFSKANLSDMFEYMSEPATEHLLATLVDRMKPGGRLAYWNLLVPRSRPASLAHRLEPQPDLAARLWRCDRAIFYSAFHLDVVRR